MVQVIFPKLISDVIKNKQVSVSANTFNELMDQLIDKYGESLEDLLFEDSGELNRYLNFYLNGKNLKTCNFSKKTLKDDDILTILVIIGGG